MNDSAGKLFFDLPREMQWAAYVLAGFGVYIIWDQSYWWMRRDDYSFGFLVPLFAGYVLHERWPEIRNLLFKGESKADEDPGNQKHFPGLRGVPIFCAGVVFLLSLLSLAFGSLLRATQGPQIPASLAAAWGYCWLVLSMVFLFGGKGVEGNSPALRMRLRLTGLFLFPAMIWLISAPLLSFLEGNLSLFLLNKVIVVVFFLFDLLGTPIARAENVLILGVLENGRPNQVMVEDACSGIRSLMACLFAGSFLAAVTLKQLWKKILMVALAMLFAFLMNILRSLFLTYWAYRYGSDSIMGPVHDITGYGVLALTCVGLIALLPLINYKHRFSGEPGLEEFAGRERISSD